MMCKLPDFISRGFRENTDKVMALCSSAHFDLVSKISRKVLKLWVLKYYMLIGDEWRLPDLVFRYSMKN